MTIVGVIGRWPHLVATPTWRETPAVFFPSAQQFEDGYGIQIGFGVHTMSDRATLSREIASVVAALDPGVELAEIQSLSKRLAGELAYPRFRATLAVSFGVGALLLAAVGLHGLVAQLVARRIPEFGIRRAVGAQTRDLLWLVARQGGTPVVVGLVFGAAGALASARMLESMLYRVEPTDPLMLGAAILSMLLAAIVAMVMPARRAAKVDPMVALRDE